MSTGYPAGMVAGIGMPIACLIPASRRFAFVAAFGYYAAGLWPMIPGAKHFTGPLRANSDRDFDLGRCGDALVPARGHWRGHRTVGFNICGGFLSPKSQA